MADLVTRTKESSASQVQSCKKIAKYKFHLFNVIIHISFLCIHLYFVIWVCSSWKLHLPISQNIFEYQVSEDKLFQGRWIQFLCVHVFHGNCVEDGAHMCELACSFHQVSPGEQTQVISLLANSFTHWVISPSPSFMIKRINYLSQTHIVVSKSHKTMDYK